ncbi:hypothetical protein HELRODRAFT_156416 [Helobdella robusta]|uniref:MICOS complex subunit n=1 Tax=Helobdella robusta TaxID=6412 RepID=T1ELV9_HELRO|nr:hypothetical protein HELRODRAFT_156416 [Helobdella robusta]ESO09223.1 hypothetical protein HELRODRAFT_156416 [Helobdella robusta]
MIKLGALVGTSAVTAALISKKTIFAAAPQKDSKIKLSELPLYDVKKSEPTFIVEEENISMLRSSISDARKFVWEYVGSMEGMIATIKDKYNVAESHTKETLAYIHEDSAVLPRIAIITVAGLGGVIAGYRGGIFKKIIYSSISVATAAAVCYPKEASDFAQQGWDYLKETTDDIWGSADKKSDTVNKKVGSEKTGETDKNVNNDVKESNVHADSNKDMYSNRST